MPVANDNHSPSRPKPLAKVSSVASFARRLAIGAVGKKEGHNDVHHVHKISQFYCSFVQRSRTLNTAKNCSGPSLTWDLLYRPPASPPASNPSVQRHTHKTKNNDQPLFSLFVNFSGPKCQAPWSLIPPQGSQLASACPTRSTGSYKVNGQRQDHPGERSHRTTFAAENQCSKKSNQAPLLVINQKHTAQGPTSASL